MTNQDLAEGRRAIPRLVIGDMNYSSWSLRGWLALRASGIAFEEVRVSLYVPGSREQLLRYSPSVKVPVYIDDSLTIWDTMAIIEYLAEDAPSLWPGDRRLRAHARSISAEMHSSFGAMRALMPFNTRARHRRIPPTPALEADLTRIRSLLEDCRQRYRSKGVWLFGDFSAADILFAPVASRFRTYDVPAEGLAGEYLHTILAHRWVEEWDARAAAEPGVLPSLEVGHAS
ncbi:MAG: glutathione S-transferase family protein [Steroidobacteraceae bacterium]